MHETTNKEHHTSTEELVRKYYEATNPVTKGSYRSIICNRLGVTASAEFSKHLDAWALREQMRRLTYSFESRSRMEEYFTKYCGLD